MDPDDDRLAIRGLVSDGDEGIDGALDGIPAGPVGVAALGECHLAEMAAAERTRFGRYYTPHSLAGHLVETAWRVRPEAFSGRVVDPACGAGSLLAAAAAHAVRRLSAPAALRWARRSLRGTDVDPVAVVLCDLAVASALLPAWMRIDAGLRPRMPAVAEVADGLADRTRATLVLTNPPFGRVGLDAHARGRYARALYGHANSATLFLHDAVRRLDGIASAAAFVFPASIVGGAYFQKLREMLAEEAPARRIAFVGERDGVFAGGVLQETLLGVFAPGPPGPIGCERITANGRIEVTDLGSMPAPADPRGPWLLPRRPADVAVVRRAVVERPGRFEDCGWRVATGPLVWNRHRDQLHDEPGPGRLPVVWAADVRPDGVDLSTRRPGRWCELREGQDWLVLDRPAILVQRTTAPEQPRRIVAAALDEDLLAASGGRVVVENHLNVCTMRAADSIPIDALLSILGSPESDQLYRCLTGSVAVSAFELNALPMPPVVTLQDLAVSPAA